MKVKSFSRVQLLATPWTVAYQAPPSMGFSRQEHWSGVPLPSPSWSLINVNQINTAVVEDTPDMDMLLLPVTFLKYISYCVSFCKKEKKKEKPLGVCFFLSK